MRKGFTLVEIMIVVAIIALLAALAIPALLRHKMSANEAFARATLKTISTAAETFAASNANGDYPVGIAALSDAVPPYLREDLTGVRQGYTFACGTIDATGYSCTATPVSATSGTQTFTIVTGGALTAA